MNISDAEESPNVESTTNSAPDNEEDNSSEEKFPSKIVQHSEQTYQREIDILQKLFPQKDKVNMSRLEMREHCENFINETKFKL